MKGRDRMIIKRSRNRFPKNQIAPLIVTLRYFSSKARLISGMAGLQSRIFSTSGLLGLMNVVIWCSMRKILVSSKLSKPSVLCRNARGIVLYLTFRIKNINERVGDKVKEHTLL